MGDRKKPSQNVLSGENPSGENPSKSPVEKTPHPILGLVEKTPQLYKKKPSFWKFGIFIHSHIENHIYHRRILLSHTHI